LEGEYLPSDEPDPRKSRKDRQAEWWAHQNKASRVHAAYFHVGFQQSIDPDRKMDMYDALGYLWGIVFFSSPAWLVILFGYAERKAPGTAFVIVAACFILPMLYFICKCIWVIARGLWNGER